MSKISDLSISLSNVLAPSIVVEEKKPLLFKLEMFKIPKIQLPTVTKQNQGY